MITKPKELMPMPGRGNGERDKALRDCLTATVLQVDPESNPEYVMGPGDEVPRLATADERRALGIESNRLADGSVVSERLYSAKAPDRKRIYIAGPMTGYPEFNFPAFGVAAAALRRDGVEPVNPATNGWGGGDPKDGTISDGERLGFYREALKLLVTCDELVLLPGWQQSQGARLEKETAEKLGMPVSLFLTFGPGAEEWSLVEPSVAEELETVLQEADRLVSTDRAGVYGHPLDDFSKVTGMALALWGRGPETPEEHALYMVLVKLARLQSTPGHHDSIVDIAGYTKTYDMVLAERARRSS